MKLFNNIHQRAVYTFGLIAEQIGCDQVKGPLMRCGYFKNGCMTARYIEKRRFFSRIYKLDITLILTHEQSPVGRAEWRKETQWAGDPCLTAWLSKHPRLSSLASIIDMENATYLRKSMDDPAKIHLITFPGCFIWTLIPPMHYFVKLTGQEIEGLRNLLSSRDESIPIQG